MLIYNASQIKNALDVKGELPLMMVAIADELIRFSNGDYVVPMPLHLSFPESNGECHVKVGYDNRDDLFIIKMATGFYTNVMQGLPSGDGLILVCCKKTGMIKAILCDGGYLTTLRTAITACLAASLTPWPIDWISVIGTGELARLVIALMHQQYPQIRVHLWGRNGGKVSEIQNEYPFVQQQEDLSSLIKQGGVVITTTASEAPLVYAHDIDAQIHLIALGADQPNKQEIDEDIFTIANLVIVDSIQQAMKFGDSSTALKHKKLQSSALIEIGSVLQSELNQQARVLITDLTGIAPQDIGIAKYVVRSLSSSHINTRR